jgi:hypothetical protein
MAFSQISEQHQACDLVCAEIRHGVRHGDRGICRPRTRTRQGSRDRRILLPELLVRRGAAPINSRRKQYRLGRIAGRPGGRSTVPAWLAVHGTQLDHQTVPRSIAGREAVRTSAGLLR